MVHSREGSAPGAPVTLVRMRDIVLASASPRRRELLSGLGLNVVAHAADIDETVAKGEDPEGLVARLAATKAAIVAARNPSELVVAADTVVVVDGEIVNKPADAAENRAFLARLSGRTHEVYTGHALRLAGRSDDVVVRTLVTFRELDAEEIEDYVVTGEGLDKAGGYAIQGRGAALVSRIDGCYSNVVGLSLPAVVESARRLGVRLV